MTDLSPRRRLLAIASCCAAIAALPLSHAAGPVDSRGPIRSQTRTPGAFTGIALRIPADVVIRAGDAESVTIETDEALLPLIETPVVQGSLEIRLREGVSNMQAGTLHVVVQARRIERMAVAGSGTIKADVLRADKVQLQLAGSGSITAANVECQAVVASIAGSGDMALAGAATRLNASISGSGRLAAARLKAESVNLSLLGSGAATVSAARELNTSLMGAGTVRYYGNPALHTSNLGSGSIRRAGGSPS